MYDIILVNPPTDITTFEGKLARKGGIHPPLGLLALTAYLRKKRFKVALLDAFGLGLSFEETVREIINLETKTIGLTAFTTNIKATAKIADMIKNKNSKMSIILGGNHITSIPLDTMNRFPQFDIGVIGEGELTITELLEREKTLPDLDGIIYRNNERLIITKKKNRIKDLDELPFPAFDLLPNFPDKYSTVATNFKRLPTTSLVTTRGCPYHCTFCDRHVFENYCRANSATYVIALIKELQNRYSIKDISFYDDTFVVFKRRLHEFCQKIIEEKMDISWSCFARVDLVNEELLRFIKKAGCWQVSYGIESGNQDILNLYKKDITIDQIKHAANITKKIGLKCRGFFMLGNPMETKDTIRDTEKILKDFDDICFAFFVPFPGNELYTDINRYGKATLEWSETGMFTPSFIPFGLTRSDLLAAYRKIHIKFYMRFNMICHYILKMIENREIKKILSGLEAFFQLISRPS